MVLVRTLGEQIRLDRHKQPRHRECHQHRHHLQRLASVKVQWWWWLLLAV
jgi:hypothetical protein